MRAQVVCATCANKWSASTPPSFAPILGELQDTGFVIAECPAGHRSVTLYDMRRYEVLLQSGALALFDGYSNESIASFAAALERGYEFFIRVVLRSRGVPQAEVNGAWKAVESQSERQLGAFYFVWLLECGEHLTLDSSIPTLRNRIIHKGRIATSEEARTFGDLIFKRLRAIERMLDKYPEATKAEQEHEVSVQRAAVPPGLDWIVLSTQTVTLDEQGTVVGVPESMYEYLASIEKARRKGFLP